MALSNERRKILFQSFIGLAAWFSAKAVRESPGNHDWINEDWDDIEDEFYEIAEEVRQLVLAIEQPKPSLYNQINNKARQHMMDIKYPVILHAYGRYNRGCNEISGEDVGEDYGVEEGDYSIFDSDRGAEEWFGEYDYDKYEYIGDPDGQKIDITECLKRNSDTLKLLEEVGETPDEWESVVLIYWDPESKSIKFKKTDPSQNY